MSYGLVVEGSFDEPVYAEFVRRLTSPTVEIVTRPAGGIPNPRKVFPALLRTLETALRDQPVNKALVIRDADDRDPAALERSLSDRIEGQAFSFPEGVHFHAVRRSVETWLLADIDAINMAVASRSGDAVVWEYEVLEDIAEPKRVLGRLLRQAGVPYTAEVGREIAALVSLDTLRDRSPSFLRFEVKVCDP